MGAPVFSGISLFSMIMSGALVVLISLYFVFRKTSEQIQGRAVQISVLAVSIFLLAFSVLLALPLILVGVLPEVDEPVATLPMVIIYFVSGGWFLFAYIFHAIKLAKRTDLYPQGFKVMEFIMTTLSLYSGLSTLGNYVQLDAAIMKIVGFVLALLVPLLCVLSSFSLLIRSAAKSNLPIIDQVKKTLGWLSKNTMSSSSWALAIPSSLASPRGRFASRSPPTNTSPISIGGSLGFASAPSSGISSSASGIRKILSAPTAINSSMSRPMASS